MKYLLILLAFPLIAQFNNGVRLYDASGSTQTSQPRTIHRYFAQGEFPSGYYPKPRVGGSVPANWQVDVESVWPDLSVMAAFVSLPVSITANGSAVVDFVPDSNPCHLGNLATCAAAALTQQQMLNFNGAAWGAVLSGTADFITYSANARTMLAAGAWTYRLRGPFVTQAVFEDVTRPNPLYDFGWQYSGGSWQAPSSDTYKSVHPVFVASFYAGWAGVEVEVLAINGATTRLQRQVFDLSVTKTSGASVYSKTAFDLPARSAFSRYFWDGSAPAAIQTDWNLRYMVHSRILPPYSYSQQWSGATDVAQFDANKGAADIQDCDPGAGRCGNWQQYIPGTGGRGDIGVHPRWYVTQIFAMGDTSQFTVAQRKEIFDKLLVGNADAAMTLPVWEWESDNSTVRDSPADGQKYYFDTAQTTPAFGRIASISARPDWKAAQSGEGSDGADAVVPVCTATPCDGARGADAAYTKGWVFDTSHMPAAFAMPYILTGRYAYLRGQMALSGWMASGTNYACYYYHTRCGDWGLKQDWGNWRSSAWSLREIAYGALLAPSAWPEREYFRRILEKNDEMWEGAYGISGGNAGVTTATNFCRGSDLGSNSVTHTSSSTNDWNGWSVYKLNGTTKVLGVAHPLYSVTGITVDGAAKTIGVRGVDTGRDWYYYPGGFTVFQDDGAAAVGAGSTVVISYHYTSVVSPWCSGRHLQMKGMSNPLRLPVWSEGNYTQSFMLNYIAHIIGWAAQTGAWLHATTGQPLFRYTHEEYSKYLINSAIHPDSNAHFYDWYVAPFVVGATNVIPQTWAEQASTFPRTAALVNTITNSATSIVIDKRTSNANIGIDWFEPTIVRIESEWINICSSAVDSPIAGQSTLTVCTGGRGMYGTTAASHSAGATWTWDRVQWNGVGYGHSYPNLYASSVALAEEYSTSTGTGRRAWERVMGSLSGLNLRMTAPEYALVPRDRITDLRAIPGTGTLVLSWIGPSPAACKVLVGSGAPASSDDASDPNSSAAGRAHSYSASGLSAGTVYYRVTCGTARVSGTATVN
jgi:hypothetical protein